MRVVMVVLDGFPLRHVDPVRTPTLWRLADGASPVDGGVQAVLTSATYPNHATFVTGAHPGVHGLWANHLVRDGSLVKAEELGPAVPTLFDACRAAGRSTIAVVGDQHLVGVCALAGADRHWPEGGRLPAGVATDLLGYAADDATLGQHLAAVGEGADLLFLQLNEPDTWGHLLGPDSEGALAQYAATDARLSALVDALGPAWHDTVLVVVSDHDMATVTGDPVDLRALAHAAGMDLVVVEEGSGALVAGPDPSEGAWLDGVPGVACSLPAAPDLRLVFAEAGRWFCPSGWRIPLAGVHGGLETVSQVGLVGGGHPAVRPLRSRLALGGVRAEDWAVTVAGLLGVRLPAATGRDLLAVLP